MSSSSSSSAAASTAVVWFKSNDLRLNDHQPLHSAHTSGATKILHLFVFDPLWFGRGRETGIPKMSYYRAKFLLESVAELRKDLRSRGSDLIVRCGSAADVVPRVAAAVNASIVYTHTEVCTEELEVHAAVSSGLSRLRNRATLKHFWGGSTLYSLDDLPFDPVTSLPDVYSSFRRIVESKMKIKAPLPIPATFKPSITTFEDGIGDPAPFPLAVEGAVDGRVVVATGANVGSGKLPSLAALGASNLLPVYKALGISNPPKDAIGIWEDVAVSSSSSSSSSSAAGTISDEAVLALPFHGDKRGVLPFKGGEKAALARLHEFIWEADALRTYKETRNGMLGANYSSKLSAWLAQGCISPRTIAAAAKEYETKKEANDSTYWLIFELIWRDYFHFYSLKYKSSLFFLWGPRDRKDPARTWSKEKGRTAAWSLGATGYPFVDANMRELLATGFMSNRGRQNVASFLVKDMEMDWRIGGEWFESLLLDHDPAVNYGNWTYVAGVGADPREDRYFLIPKQARDYDPRGDYMRVWLPELSSCAADALMDPGRMSEAIRARGKYPAPVVSLLAHRKPREDKKGGKGGSGGGAKVGSSAAASDQAPRPRDRGGKGWGRDGGHGDHARNKREQEEAMAVGAEVTGAAAAGAGPVVVLPPVVPVAGGGGQGGGGQGQATRAPKHSRVQHLRGK